MPYNNIQRRTDSVSRQMTPAETAIEQDVEDQALAPEINYAKGSDLGTAYHYMAEDMKARAQSTAHLAATQQMAYAASARRELHNQTLEKGQIEDDAAGAMKEFSQRLMDDPEADENDVMADIMLKNPKLAGNEVLQKSAEDLMKFHQSTPERRMRKLQRDSAMLKGETDYNKAIDYKSVYDNNRERGKDIIQLGMDAEWWQAQTEVSKGEIEKIASDYSLKQSRDILRSIEETGDSSIKSPKYLAGALGAAAEAAGLEHIENIDFEWLAERTRQPGGDKMLAMLTNPIYMRKLMEHPGRKQYLEEFLKDPKERADHADVLLGRYDYAHPELKEAAKPEPPFQSFVAGIAKGFEDSSDKMMTEYQKAGKLAKDETTDKVGDDVLESRMQDVRVRSLKDAANSARVYIGTKMADASDAQVRKLANVWAKLDYDSPALKLLLEEVNTDKNTPATIYSKISRLVEKELASGAEKADGKPSGITTPSKEAMDAAKE